MFRGFFVSITCNSILIMPPMMLGTQLALFWISLTYTRIICWIDGGTFLKVNCNWSDSLSSIAAVSLLLSSLSQYSRKAITAFFTWQMDNWIGLSNKNAILVIAVFVYSQSITFSIYPLWYTVYQWVHLSWGSTWLYLSNWGGPGPLR